MRTRHHLLRNLLALEHLIVVLKHALDHIPDEYPFGPAASQLVHPELLFSLAELLFLVGSDQVLLHDEEHAPLLLLVELDAAQLLRLRHFEVSLEALVLDRVRGVERTGGLRVGDGKDPG